MSKNSDPIRVVVIDDHPLIRTAVRAVLDGRGEIAVVAEGFAGEHVVPLVDEYRPDVLVLDLSMPQYAEGGHGRFDVMEATAMMEARGIRPPIVVLSQQTHSALIDDAIRLGVRGYLLKSDDLSLRLDEAIRAVSRGELYFSEEISRMLFGDNPVSDVVLTQRQQEVMLAIARDPDLSFAELGRKYLNISRSTFKGHVEAVYKELGVNNKTAAVIYCIQRRLIPFSLENGRLEFGDL